MIVGGVGGANTKTGLDFEVKTDLNLNSYLNRLMATIYVRLPIAQAMKFGFMAKNWRIVLKSKNFIVFWLKSRIAWTGESIYPND